jgi:intracellular multiplication protein IcmL
MTNEDALELVRLRNNFYRDNYRRLVGILLVMIIVNLLLIGTVIYLLTSRPSPVYFATSPDGRITPLHPLNEPIVTPPELLQWVTEAAVETYSYNFVNYRQELQRASEYFTPEGWNQFQQSLRASRNLETVIAKKMVVSATPTGAPEITDQGLLNGRYAWRVRLPLLVTYQNAQEQIQQPITVNMVVLRVPLIDSPKGIAIAQFVAAERPITAPTR